MKSSESYAWFSLVFLQVATGVLHRPVNKRDSPYYKPQRAVMKVGEEGWYSELMWPNAQCLMPLIGF